MVLSPQAAQLLTDSLKLLGKVVVWVVTDADQEHRGKVIARAHTANADGRVYPSGVLVADSLLELRLQRPVGLRKRNRDAYHVSVVSTPLRQQLDGVAAVI